MSSTACKTKTMPCSDTTTCEPKFKGKGCKCVTVKGDACNPVQTMCAYEDGGVYYGCSTGCCANQCEGQCPSTFSSAPIPLGSVTTETSTLARWGLAVLILFVALMLASTVSLIGS